MIAAPVSVAKIAGGLESVKLKASVIQPIVKPIVACCIIGLKQYFFVELLPFFLFSNVKNVA